MTLVLMVVFWIIIAYKPLLDDDPNMGAIELTIATIAMIYFLPLILLSVAPAKAVSRRLIFLGLGLLLLIALNELSKLGLDVTALKVQG
jgi:hypothetical protein